MYNIRGHFSEIEEEKKRDLLFIITGDILYDVDESSEFVSNKGQMSIFDIKLPLIFTNQIF
jgi:hypothetical protein